MLTRYALDSEPDMRRWDSFVESHPEGTPFHLSGWLRTIAQTYAFEPVLCALQGSHGNIEGIAPFFRQRSLLSGSRLVCLPFSDFCAPLGFHGIGLRPLTDWLRNGSARSVRRIEIRGGLADSAGFECRTDYKHHTLRLHADPEAVLKHVDKHTIIYNIRKARREGVRIIRDNTQGALEEFYRLNLLTRKKHGVPSQPRNFFTAFARNLLDSDRAYLLLAMYQSRPVAAGVFMKLPGKIFYKYNVSDPRCLSKIVPNHLLTWTAIEQACLDGYEVFDFGRTMVNNTGLMRYKRMWGAEERDLPYYFHPTSGAFSLRNERALIYQLNSYIWRHLPESIVSRIGPAILKRLG